MKFVNIDIVVSPDVLHPRIETAFWAKQALSWLKKNQRELEKEIKDHFNKTIKIIIEVIESNEDDQETPDEKLPDKDEMNKKIKEDPLLHKLVEDLGLELT